MNGTNTTSTGPCQSKEAREDDSRGNSCSLERMASVDDMLQGATLLGHPRSRRVPAALTLPDELEPRDDAVGGGGGAWGPLHRRLCDAMLVGGICHGENGAVGYHSEQQVPR
jgi:hypothetical protein